MANKDSYWRKHKEKIHGEKDPVGIKKTFSPISAEKREDFQEGAVIIIDKPLHWTSFDAVRKIRNSIGIKKVGHAGTLDPLASGLLIICTGKFTKKINEFMAQEKEYTGFFTLGAVTATYDLETEPEQKKDISGITMKDIQDLLGQFTGEIRQVPPVYSAIKKQGIPLYELARKGQVVQPQARTVHIKSFEIAEVNLPLVQFKIVCSTGTYIRSLAHDFGAALGCGGYLSELRRTRIGEFLVDDALTMDKFLNSLTA